MRRELAVAVGGVVVILAAAVAVQSTASLDSRSLAWVAAGCCAVGALAVLPRLRTLRGILAAYLGWRVAFFPVLVLSGHAAALAEWSARAVGAPPVGTYPVLFLGMGLGTAAATLLVYGALLAPTWRRRAILAVAMLPGAFVSFTGPGDLAPLADLTPWVAPQEAEVRNPTSNVYEEALEAEPPGPRMPLLAAASVTYALIPDAPWARRVQGSLEAEFLANPGGSSIDRVQEHFRAFSAAHAALAWSGR